MVTWTNDINERRVEEEEAFVASHIFHTISDGQTAEVLIHLPGGGNIDADIRRVELTAAGDAEGTILKNPNISSTGTQVVESNILINSTVTSDLDVYQGGTYTGGTAHLEWYLPGGEKNRATGVSDNAAQLHLNSSEGDSAALLRITNVSGAATDMSVVLAWEELDEKHG